MIDKNKKNGYIALTRQAALILCLIALIWSVTSGIDMGEALLRAAVVYFAASTIAMLLRVQLVRLTLSEGEVDIPVTEKPAEDSAEVVRQSDPSENTVSQNSINNPFAAFNLGQ